MEASYCIDNIRIELPEKHVVYHYKIEVSVDDNEWKEIIQDKVSTEDSRTRSFHGDFGCNVAFVRITFLSKDAGLAEVSIGGK